MPDCLPIRFCVWVFAILFAATLPSAVITAADTIPSYQSQDNAEVKRHLHSLNEYVESGTITSPLGMALRADQRELKSGGFASGLLIIAIAKGSPAANAGLNALQETPKQVLTGLLFLGALAFPPALILFPVFQSLQIGQDGDLIIAVDGSRVTNIFDFAVKTRDVQAGQIVYLSIVRRGERMQVPVHIPSNGSQQAPS